MNTKIEKAKITLRKIFAAAAATTVVMGIAGAALVIGTSVPPAVLAVGGYGLAFAFALAAGNKTYRKLYPKPPAAPFIPGDR